MGMSVYCVLESKLAKATGQHSCSMHKLIALEISTKSSSTGQPQVQASRCAASIASSHLDNDNDAASIPGTLEFLGDCLHCPGSRSIVLCSIHAEPQPQTPAMLCPASRNTHCVGQVTDKLLWPHIALGVALHIWDDLDGCCVFRQEHHIGHIGPMHPDDGGQVVECLHGQPEVCVSTFSSRCQLCCALCIVLDALLSCVQLHVSCRPQMCTMKLPVSDCRRLQL